MDQLFQSTNEEIRLQLAIELTSAHNSNENYKLKRRESQGFFFQSFYYETSLEL